MPLEQGTTVADLWAGREGLAGETVRLRARVVKVNEQIMGKNWVHLRFVGSESNRSAIGTRVKVPVGDRVLMQEVAAGQGFSSTNSPMLIFGLGAATETGEITIRWPSGTVQTIEPVAANQALVVTEGSDQYRRVY